MNKREAQIFKDQVIQILIEERERQGLKRSRMAVDLGMSKSSVKYIEEFSQNPSLCIVGMIMEYLGLTLEEVGRRLKLKSSENKKLDE